MPTGPQILFDAQNQQQDSSITPATGTIFGASGPTISSPSILHSICGSPSVSRTDTIIDLYNGGGDSEADIYLAAGDYIFINLNMSPVKKDTNGNKIPNPFPTDLVTYKNKIKPFFQFYANHPKKDHIILCCENEPTTEMFHSGPMSDYLAILTVFVSLGIEYGYKVADGGVHVSTVNGANSTEGEGKAAQVAQLLAGYAQIQGLYAINLHTSNTSDDYDSASTVRAVNKIKNLTGYNTVSNEWHAQNTDPNNTSLMTKMAKGWGDAGVQFSVYISGTSDKNMVLNSGSTITPIGNSYKSYINSLK